MTDTLENARTVLQATREGLLQRAHVVATGLGYKLTEGQKTATLCLMCSVEKKYSAAKLSAQDLVPRSLDGIPTDVVESGRLLALASRTERHRPAPGGVSIGHQDITAGTLGCLVKKNGQLHILSNNHVLANSNNAQRGDAILQPGPLDGGRYPADHIAELADFIALNFDGGDSSCSIAKGVASFLNALASLGGSHARMQAITARAGDNLVDAAIARPLSANDVSADILQIGSIAGTTAGVLGMNITKSGRTTALTTGVIEQIDVTATVQYGAGRTARFSDQLLAGAMSQGGDSGSAVLDDNRQLVGLLFAGSNTTTIINRIEHVFSALGVGL